MKRNNVAEELPVDEKSKTKQPTSEMKKVIKREEYYEPREETKAVSAVQPPLPIAQIELPDEEEEEENKFFSFLDRLDKQQGFRLRIESLPQYSINGKWAKDVETGFCGELPISIDDLYSEEYYSQIQALYGTGAFRVALKDSGGKFVKKWLVKIAAPSQNQQPQNGYPVAGSQQAQQPQQPQGDPLDGLIAQAEKFNRLKKALGWPDQTTLSASNAAPEPSALQEKPIEERILTVLLEKAVEKGDEGAVDKIVSRLLGDNKTDDGWMEIIKQVMPAFLPMAMQLFQNFLQPQTQQPASAVISPVSVPQGQTIDVSPLAEIPVPPAAAGTAVAMSPPGQSQNDPLARLMQKVAFDCLDNLTLDPSVESYFAFVEGFPERANEAGFLLAASPQDVLQRLSLEPSLPRVQWILDFQNAVKEEAMSGEQSEALVIQ
jgi:hypothetical protein